MKIVHLTWSLDYGGVETMLVDIANAQSETAKVAVIIVNDRIEPTILSRFSPSVSLKCLRRPEGTGNPWYTIRLFLVLRRMAPDIVHAHQESFIKVLRYFNAHKVHTVHNTGIQLSAARRHFNKVYAISEAVQTDLVRRYPDMEPIVIPNGIVCDAIAVKTRYGGKPFRIVQIGRLDPVQKGQDILIKAVALILGKTVRNAATVDFIGTGTSRTQLLELTREQGVEDMCNFLGQKTREEIYRDLKTYDLLVQPSRFEGFGLTVVEAMAAGVPVLVSDVDGPMEIIDHGQYGAYFVSEDPADCATRILEIMEVSGSEGFAKRQARNAAYARANFDISQTADKYLAEYRMLCQH